MRNPPEDDALSWDGDDDPTLVSGASKAPSDPPASEPALPEGFTAVGKGSTGVGRLEADGTITPAAAPEPLGNAMLITLGVLGGAYLLFTIGWVVGGLRLQEVAFFLVTPAAYVPAFWLAVLAPAIWFTTTLLLTRRSAGWLRLSWLVAGAVLFVPWPFIMMGAVGR